MLRFEGTAICISKSQRILFEGLGGKFIIIKWSWTFDMSNWLNAVNSKTIDVKTKHDEQRLDARETDG